jgi:hypothetical protein
MHAPIRTPNQVAGDAMAHWYQFTSENLLDLGKAVAYTGGYLIGTRAAIAGVVASCTTVVACGGGIAVGTPTVVKGTQVYYSKMKQLHGTDAKGDILSPGKKIKDKDDTPCKISDVNIELLDSKYLVIQTGKSTSAKGSLGFGSAFGARLVNSRPGTSDAFVQVHWWYDMGSAIRYRPVYTVDHAGLQ